MRIESRECAHCATSFLTVATAKQRFCTPVCGNDARRAPQKMCAGCGVNPVKRGRHKYCSRECGTKPRKPSISCVKCGTEFYTVRKQKYCSLKCYKSTLPLHTMCRNCGKDTGYVEGVYCSATCSSAGRRIHSIGHPCLTCGEPVSEAGGKYCSRACSSASQRKVKILSACPQCGVMAAIRKDRKFCSMECAAAARAATRHCKICGTQVNTRRLLCSDECAKAARQSSKQEFTQEMLDAIRFQVGAGIIYPIIGAEHGLNAKQVAYLVKRYGWTKPRVERVSAPKQPKPPKIIKVVAPKPPKFKPALVSAPQHSHDARRSIPLREVIRLAAEYGVARDVNAVSRAARAEMPDHPGYRLETKW